MGLNLDGLHVTVDHSHNRLLNTGKAGNPTVRAIADLRVFSVFQRLKAPNSMSRHHGQRPNTGDNCHLLYALKGKGGLTTDVLSIKRLLEYFDGILDDIYALSAGYDLVVSMPSNHNISHILGRRLARKFNCSHLQSVFDKISVTDARNLLQNANLDRQTRQGLTFRLKQFKGHEDFPLKCISTEHRHLFPPITQNPRFPLPGSNYTKIMLADDLLSTGTTLLEARRLLKLVFPAADVDATCLFGAVAGD